MTHTAARWTDVLFEWLQKEQMVEHTVYLSPPDGTFEDDHPRNRMVTSSKRLDPSWTLSQLGVTLRYPDFETGLAAIWAQEGASLVS